MEAIILQALYAATVVAVTYLITSTVKHKADCQKQEAIGLASIHADQRLLSEHHDEIHSNNGVSNGADTRYQQPYTNR